MCISDQLELRDCVNQTPHRVARELLYAASSRDLCVERRRTSSDAAAAVAARFEDEKDTPSTLGLAAVGNRCVSLVVRIEL